MNSPFDTWSSLFRLVMDDDRRKILFALRAAPPDSMSVDELATRVVQFDPTSDLTPTHLEGLRRDLHHVHVPKLADVGVIEFDRRSQTIRYRPCDPLADVLDVVERYGLELSG